MATFLKTWGLAILTAVLALGGSYLYKKKVEQDAFNQIEVLKKAQQEEIDKINAARAQEQAAYANNQRDYEAAIKSISTKYQATLHNLEIERQNKINTILLNKDPKVLADQLSQELGFEVTP